MLIIRRVQPTLKTVKLQQSLLNASTRGQWAMFASHRQQIERLLLGADRSARQSICVLGAGNCNDLDLQWLQQIYGAIHLIDIDEEALKEAVSRQKAGSQCIRCLAPVDLTGIASIVEAWGQQTPVAFESVKAAVNRARDVRFEALEAERFDAVLSPCVLSQLLNPARDALAGTGRPSYSLLAALRQRHLRLMLDLLSPAGTGLLICDLISSDKVPPLLRATEDELPGLMRTLLTNGKCFKPLHPSELVADLVALRASRIRCTAPWLWRLGFHRTYLVYGVEFGPRT